MPIHSNMPCQCFPTSSWPQTHQGGKLVCPTTLGTFWKNNVKTHFNEKITLDVYTGGTNVLITAHIYSYEKPLKTSGSVDDTPTKKIRANQPCKPWQIHLALIDSIVKDLWIVEKRLLVTVDGSEIRITVYDIWNPINSPYINWWFFRFFWGSINSSVHDTGSQFPTRGPATRGEIPRHTKRLRLGVETPSW